MSSRYYTFRVCHKYRFGKIGNPSYHIIPREDIICLCFDKLNRFTKDYRDMMTYKNAYKYLYELE